MPQIFFIQFYNHSKKYLVTLLNIKFKKNEGRNYNNW